MPSPHPSCLSIDTLVTPYIDGELGAADRQLVDHHLVRCGACRSRVAAEQSVHDLMQERKPGLCHGHAPALLRSHCAEAARLSAAAAKTRGAGTVVVQRAWTGWFAPLGAAASLFV